MDDAETGQRGFLLTGKEDYLKPFQKGAQNATKELAALRPYLDSRPASRATLNTLRSLVEQKFVELDTTIGLRRTKGLSAALAIMQNDAGKNIMDMIRALCQRSRIDGARISHSGIAETLSPFWSLPSALLP
jgi:CHASE3 domain sensor protein